MQPFLADKNSREQGFATSEPFTIEKGGVKPACSCSATSAIRRMPQTRRRHADKPGGEERTRSSASSQASAEGWKSYLANPAPGNALIRKDNPQMTQDVLDYGVDALRRYHLVDGGDAARQGLMTMTADRWQKTRDFMVSQKLLDAKVDVRKAYTTELVDQVRVLP